MSDRKYADIKILYSYRRYVLIMYLTCLLIQSTRMYMYNNQSNYQGSYNAHYTHYYAITYDKCS